MMQGMLEKKRSGLGGALGAMWDVAKGGRLAARYAAPSGPALQIPWRASKLTRLLRDALGGGGGGGGAAPPTAEALQLLCDDSSAPPSSTMKSKVIKRAERSVGSSLVALGIEALMAAQKVFYGANAPVIKLPDTLAEPKLSLAEGLRLERRLFHSLLALEDQKEGMGAFVEKRAPQWVDK